MSTSVCVRACVSVCLCVCVCVCPRGYLRNHKRDLYQIFRACCLSPWPCVNKNPRGIRRRFSVFDKFLEVVVRDGMYFCKHDSKRTRSMRDIYAEA